MSFDKDYQEFIEWITDPEKSGSMGPVKYTKEEDAFARLFAAYLNCRYPSAPPNNAMHSDGEGQRKKEKEFPMPSLGSRHDGVDCGGSREENYEWKRHL